MDKIEQTPLLQKSAEIVAAFVAKNSLPIAELPSLIASIHGAMKALSEQPVAEPEKPQPAIPVKRSITPDLLFSLEDGKGYKTLSRHLAVRGLIADEYREKWGLPLDYPMVAANYAQRRSEVAKALGFGRRRKVEAPENANDQESARELADAKPSKYASAKPGRGRRRKADAAG